MSQTTDRPSEQATGNHGVDADHSAAHPHPDVSVASPGEPVPVGDPGMIGVPAFMIGSIALGLVLVGFVPATATGASIPIIMTATGIGQLIAAVWAARLAENASAAIFIIFAGFWLSYAALVLGLTHNWFGITAADALGTQELFLTSWLILIVLLTVVSLRLPLAFTVLFALVDVALLLVLLGTANGDTSLTRAGGYVVFAFVLVGAYLFLNGMSVATGGREYPLGTPVLH
ncbi:MAG: putative transrane protein [Modestobacter sp.]|nr:putative transrane protein [Modestobacter sp.]